MKLFLWLAALLVVVPVAASPQVRIAAKIEPVIQEGHAWGGREPQFAVSPDEKWVASSSTHLKLWNTRGELVRDLEAPRFAVSKPIFAPDSRQLFFTGAEGTTVYQLPSGRKLREMPDVEISDTARYFILRTAGSLRFSEVKTGKPLATVDAYTADGRPEILNFSPDGNLVAAAQPRSYSSDGKVRLWNLRSGKLLHTLADPPGVLAGRYGVIGPLLWSSDSQNLVTGGEDPNWKEPEPSDNGSGTEAAYYHAYAVKVWDVKTGQLRHAWPGYGNSTDGVALRGWVSKSEVRVGGYEDAVLNIATGKRRKSGNFPVASGPQIVYVSNRTGFFELRDASDQKTLQSYPARAFSAFEELVYSPDGALLAAAETNDSAVKIYDARSGALKIALPLDGEAVFGLKWLSDGNICATSLQSARIWRPDGTLVRRFAPPKPRNQNYYNDSVSVSPDGSLFLSNADVWSQEPRTMAHIWNSNGQLLRDIPDFGAQDEALGGWYEGRIRWIDASRVALPTKTGVEIWDVRAGKRQAALPTSPDFKRLAPSLASPDGRLLLCVEEDGTQKRRTVLFETTTWTRVKTFDGIEPLTWSGDSQRFIGRQGDGEVTLIFPISGDAAPQKMRLQVPPGGNVGFSPDLKFAALHPGDYRFTHIDITRVADGKRAVSLYLFGIPPREVNAEPSFDAPHFWLALTPNNFYDGSPGVEKWLRWRQNGVLLPVGALQKTLRKPARVRVALK